MLLLLRPVFSFDSQLVEEASQDTRTCAGGDGDVVMAGFIVEIMGMVIRDDNDLLYCRFNTTPADIVSSKRIIANEINEYRSTN